MIPRIPLSVPHMAPDVLESLTAAIASNWIAHVGPSVDAFEAELAAHVGAAGCLATHSGTAALHLALRLLGVGSGDVVLCSALTFVASATPILYLGATPAFVDVEPSGTMSIRALERALEAHGTRVKAIVVVHLYGQPADMPSIVELATRCGVPIVEDAAQALGAAVRDRHVGTWGAFGVYSFAANKIITTSTGGALVANDAALIARAHWLAQQARDDVPHYQHSALGYNYRMSNVLAELGRSQLRVLDERVQARRAVFARYRAALSQVPGVAWLAEPAFGRSNRWLSVMLMAPPLQLGPEALIAELASHGVEARQVFYPLQRQPLFHGAPYYPDGPTSHSDAFFATGICLPSSSDLSEHDQRSVIDVTTAALERSLR